MRRLRSEEEVAHLHEVQKLFSKQVEPLRGKLLSRARYLCKDVDVAEDLVQDTLLRRYRNFDYFKQGSSLNAWLFFCLKNNLINMGRNNPNKVFIKAARIDDDTADGRVDLKNTNDIRYFG